MIQDDRTPEEVEETIGFIIATDNFMSGWGKAKGGRSLVARPIRTPEEADKIKVVFHGRDEFKNIGWHPGKKYKPRMKDSDHLHIYNFASFNYQ